MATQQSIYKDDTSLDAAVADAKIKVHAGGQTISGNNDYSGVTRAVLCDVHSGFTGTGFSAGAPMTMAFVDRFWYGAGGGHWYWKSASSGSTVTNRVFIAGGGTLHIDGSGTTTNAHQRSGGVECPNGHTVTNAYLRGGVANFYDTGSAAAITLLHALGSNIRCERPITTAKVSGGQLTLEADSTGAVNAHGTIEVYNGGSLVVNDTGEITSLAWVGGQLLWPCNRDVVIAACTIDPSLPGAREFLNNPNIYFEGGGPTLIVHDGR